MANHFSTSIHVVIKELIEAKSKRDKINFTSYQLANILSMPRSVITKLTHGNASKRINNPRIETLIKIVDFFKADGFNITLDDLIKFDQEKVNIQSQSYLNENKILDIPLYSLNNRLQKKGSIDINFSKLVNAVAFYAEDSIADFFKAGSIFIVDIDAKVSQDNLIAVRFDNSDKVYIKKYIIKNKKTILQAIDNNSDDIILMPTQTLQIIGVIIQVNAKT